jgi:hypothetical protein
MSEYLNDPKIFWTLIALVAIAAIAALYLFLPKEKKSKEIVTSEWQPTGKIDFHCADTPKDDTVPATFLLRVEDFRTVESISGVEHMEIRWRSATLAEAKSVVVAHQNATDTRTKNAGSPITGCLQSNGARNYFQPARVFQTRPRWGLPSTLWKDARV